MKKGWIATEKPKSRVKKGYDMPEPMHMVPTLHLTDKDLPVIKEWKVDQTYEVALKIKQTGIRTQDYGGNKEICADFEVQAIKVQ